MPQSISLKISKLNEEGTDYYLATSKDVPGLVAEGQSIEEVTAIAKDLAFILASSFSSSQDQPI